jgi:NhaB family Na+:H+ antiporter
MVSAIAFMQELLVYVFSKALTAVRSQTGLALTFCATAALLSAFLDALTVIAVVMTVVGFSASVSSPGLARRRDGHFCWYRRRMPS